jgi:folate-binding protein YgfZ
MNTSVTEFKAPISVVSFGDKLFCVKQLNTELRVLLNSNVEVSIQLNTPEATEISIFELAGVDVASYLQRRTSNDVLALAIGEGQANTFLDKKAYLQAVFSLHRVSDSVFYALVPTVLTSEFEQEINRFKIMEQFSCTNQTEQWQVVAQINKVAPPEKVANTIVHHADLGAYEITAPFWMFGSEGVQLNATLWLYPANNPLHLPLESQTLAMSTFKALQCLWGVAQWGRETSHQTQLPETGLEHWTVSYTKGCFLGQETVARVRTYGGVQQTLMGVKLTIANPLERNFQALLTETISQPWQVLFEDKPIATITAGVFDEETQTLYGLAYLNRAFRLPGVQAQPVIFKSGEQPISVSLEIVLLPFSEGFPLAEQTNQPLSVNHQPAQRLHEVAMSHFVENRKEEALQVLNQLLATYPDFLEAYETKGVLLSRLARYDEAIATMHQLLAKNDKHVMAYTNLSVFWLKLNDKDQAEHYKAKATSVAMGQKMAEAMAKKAALQKTVAGVATIGSSTVLSEEEALAHHKKKLEEKIALFQHALQFAPTDALAHYGLGTTYLELHQLEAAASAFEQAVSLNPKHSQAYLHWAETLFSLQHFKAVAEVLAKGIPLSSSRGDLQPLAQMKNLQEKLTPFL